MSTRNYAGRLRDYASDLTKNRPLSFMAAAGGLRDALLGLGFIFSVEDIRKTQLYIHYNELLPGVTGIAAGWILLIVGVLVMVSALTGAIKRTQVCLDIQTFVWLFSAVMYTLNYDLLLATVFGVFFAIPAAYMSYWFKHKFPPNTS